MLRPVAWLGKQLRRSTPPPEPVAPTPPVAELVARVLGPYSTTVVDVGARGGMDQVWYRIPPVARLFGFEPDPLESARLNQIAAEKGEVHSRYVPLALGRTPGPATLYHTADPACTSLYPPNLEMRARHPVLDVITPVGESTIQLTTLAEWAHAEDIREVAFLKLDTQGAELDILQGAGSVLDGCLGVEVEVEFQPIYQGQPLFADVDIFLRGQGFSLWRLDNFAHYSEHPSPRTPRWNSTFFDHHGVTFPVGSGRLTWANAVYFRDFRRVPGLSPRQFLLLAALFDALGDTDAAGCCLERCPRDFLPGDSQQTVTDFLTRFRAA